jgi:hypothetical protein
MHSSIKAKAKLAAKTLAYVSAGLATSFALSVNTANAAAVGEIVLVAGQCPGGFIPLDGRELKGDVYPELAAVLNTDAIALPPLAPRFSTKVETTRDTGNTRDPIKQPIIKDPKEPIAVLPGFTEGNETTNVRTNQSDAKLGSLEPKYCIATGGDTAPLVEIGLSYSPGQRGQGGELKFQRVNVSGYENIPAGFADGDIDINALQRANPGIGRPNVSFVLVGENICVARRTMQDANGNTENLFYPGELRMSGVQVAKFTTTDKDRIPWGDDFEEQSKLAGQGDVSEANFAYTTQQDEKGRFGFVAVDIVDDRAIVLENRNVTNADFSYRVQAQCGEPGSATNVYYDPLIRNNGGGGTGGFPY